MDIRQLLAHRAEGELRGAGGLALQQDSYLCISHHLPSQLNCTQKKSFTFSLVSHMLR